MINVPKDWFFSIAARIASSIFIAIVKWLASCFFRVFTVGAAFLAKTLAGPKKESGLMLSGAT